MTSPTPGWYPDPGGTAPFRWWNGQAWTAATSDGSAPPAAQQPVTAPSTPTGYVDPAAYGSTQAAAGTTTPGTPFGTPTESPFAPGAGGGQTPGTAYGTKSPFDSQGNLINPVAFQGKRASDSMWDQNRFAMITMIVAAIYIFIALSTGFGIIGIVPIALAMRSMSRGEKLAPIALGAAAISLVVGIMTFTHHF